MPESITPAYSVASQLEQLRHIPSPGALQKGQPPAIRSKPLRQRPQITSSSSLKKMLFQLT
ncbi:hypothetical protein [Planococcus antarcticus]|uniref:hypothetical protein n=1 Tax=Planococcus antarcticus TaxID=161360 RepID=UPI000B0B257D|nr:hypothetical protein [Planococcus antarcticus]